jgi:probable F420-dependent oxidoreductase
MHIGILIFATDTTIQPVELARAAEDMGFESVWLPEHSHIPASRKTPWGGIEGAPPLPEHYWRTHDVFTAFGAMAAVTTDLKFGSGVTLAAQRDPIWTAKQVATVDHLSGGRLMVGVGYGWNKEEMAHHGTPYLQRRAMLREHVLAMKALWTQDEASFEGEHISFEPSWAWPKPVQRPHPPIFMGGGAGPKTIADMVEFCDGWLPMPGRHDLVGKMDDVRAALRDAGRDADAFQFTIYGAPKTERELGALAEAGVDRAIFSMPSVEPQVVLEKMRDRSAFVGMFD